MDLFKYVLPDVILISMHIPVIFTVLARQVLQLNSCSLTEIRSKESVLRVNG